MRAIVFSVGLSVFADRVRAALDAGRIELLRAADLEELLARVRDSAVDLVIIETERSPVVALAAARELREVDGQVPLLLALSDCSGETAVSAMRAGVNDIVSGACSDAEIADVVARLMCSWHRPPLRIPLAAGHRLVGNSRALEQLRQAIQRVAATDTNVVITGESGTGKELAAELIHCNSRRRDKPFVSLNCAAIPDGLLESELFGYERGAFTGAHAAREGKLQYAQGGTLFLDEIGDMNLFAQAKILRAIENRKVQRLGGNRDIAVDIRIIAATNRNLEQLTLQQRFRQDLYFRLNVARLHLPPLRDHAEDIPALVDHLLAEIASRCEQKVDGIDRGFVEPLLRYDWPGNVRELRNVLESTLVFAGSSRITARDLPPYLRALFGSARRRQESERETILAALRGARWNRNDAARTLGFSRMTLYRKMVKFDLFAHEEEDQSGECNSANVSPA